METEQRAEPSISTMEAPSLFDLVKKNIFSSWYDCWQLEKKIHRQRAEGGKDMIFNGEYDFKAGVMALWRAIEFKLDYHKDTEVVKELRALEKRGLFSEKNLDKANWLAFDNAFRLMGAYLELSGVTRYERKKPRADLEAIEGLDEEEY